jgi:hypothetical protein
MKRRPNPWLMSELVGGISSRTPCSCGCVFEDALNDGRESAILWRAYCSERVFEGGRTGIFLPITELGPKPIFLEMKDCPWSGAVARLDYVTISCLKDGQRALTGRIGSVW